MAPRIEVAHSVISRRPMQSPRINWLEMAAGWALAVALQMVLLFLGFGLGAGAIDLRSAGEELRQQLASALMADRSAVSPTWSIPAGDQIGEAAFEQTGATDAALDRNMGPARVANVLPDLRAEKTSPIPSIGGQLLDHAGPVVFWLAIWGAITWLASIFTSAPRTPSSVE
ncbi:protein of unknown function [Nitrospira japonica]|uniref:Transmembrane protein n=1 Tax=Nitrospira japonica TaxID=1325564 RepID=A0A1W1I2S5_9BACT|nr:hypothetical protein [Nitrospira japonica]SLM47316.1 protein of unknown function [Nitrospira japonica]